MKKAPPMKAGLKVDALESQATGIGGKFGMI